MTRYEADSALWERAVQAFAGQALADIQAAAGVSLSVARRLRAAEPMGLYMHAPTREALQHWERTQGADATPVRQSETPLAIPQHFATESERISFARGVLLMGAETNRITSESSHQVARAIQAAMAALLAPIELRPTTVPAPTAARPAGQKERLMAALATPEATDAAPAPPRRRKAR